MHNINLKLYVFQQHWVEGLRFPLHKGVKVYAIVWIAFACSGHDLQGACELGPYNIVLPLPTATSAKLWGDRPCTI